MPSTWREASEREIARTNRLLAEADRAEERLADELKDDIAAVQQRAHALVVAGGSATALTARIERLARAAVATMIPKLDAGVREAAALGVVLVDDLADIAGANVRLDGDVVTPIARRSADYANPLLAGCAALIAAGAASQLAALAAGRQDLAVTLRAFGTEPMGSTVFGRASARAELVARTEAGYAHGEATHLRLREAARSTEIRKRWVTSHRKSNRASHIAAERRYQIGATPGPIPFDDKFVVGGHKTLYPRGPGLPGDEKLNCRCRVVPVFP